MNTMYFKKLKNATAFLILSREKCLEQFLGELPDNDWQIEMKTDRWKTSLLERTIRIVHLESRFQ